MALLGSLPIAGAANAALAAIAMLGAFALTRTIRGPKVIVINQGTGSS